LADYDSSNSDNQDYLGVKESKLKIPITVSKVLFAYTNRLFCVASSEGIYIFSLDSSKNLGSLVITENVSPKKCILAFKTGNYNQAITFAIYLNLSEYLEKFICLINIEKVEYITSKLSLNTIVPLLVFFARRIESDNNIQLNLIWIFSLLKNNKLKFLSNDKNKEIFYSLNKALLKHYKSTQKLLEENYYSLKFLLDQLDK
jgi:periodic tryptophan protein 2